jgi:hypothetical protein
MTQGTWQVCPSGGSTYYDGYTTIDSTAVHMDNGATAALYWYTPHFAGNQNFVNLWVDTFNFGALHVADYSWQVLNQYAYADQTKTTGMGTTNLLPDQRVYVGFTVKNTGATTWYNTGTSPIKAGTASPLDRMSAFCDVSTWTWGCNRPAVMQESSVAPGQTATFEFWMDVPYAAGTYQEHFDLVADGVTWFPDQGLSFYFTVQQPVYSWRFTGQYAYTDQTKTTGKATTGLLPGDRVYVGFTAKNTGNTTWVNGGPNPMNVGMTHPIDRASPFYDASWLGTNRPAHMIESSVAPGQIGTFEYWMKVPSNATPGTYLEYFNLVDEGVTWLNDPNMNFDMTIN